MSAKKVDSDDRSLVGAPAGINEARQAMLQSCLPVTPEVYCFSDGAARQKDCMVSESASLVYHGAFVVVERVRAEKKPKLGAAKEGVGWS